MNKTIVVTGGNRGIGKQLCLELAELGYVVILTARDKEKATEATSFIKKTAPNSSIYAYELDVTDPESVKNLFSYVNKEFGQLDVLVNNAGIMSENTDTLKVNLEDLQNTMATNFLGPLQVSQSLMPLLSKTKGKIINVSSGMGALNETYHGYTGYQLSKTALNALTILMSNDVSTLGIRVFAVCPGWVKTDMGGSTAPRTLEEGVAGIKWLITEDEAESGKFYRDKKQIDF